MEKSRHGIGEILLGALMRALGSLPLSFHRKMAKAVAWFLRDVMHYRSHVVMTNLSRCFPEKEYDELKRIHDRFYLHLATVFTEMIWFGACRGDKGRARLHKSHIVEITNPEELNRMIRSGRQLMVMQAHTGNWELTGGIMNYSYSEPVQIDPAAIAVAYMRLHSGPAMNNIMEAVRTAPAADTAFDGYVEATNALRFALSRRSLASFVYMFITDQYPHVLFGSKAHPLFMGRQVVSMTGAAALASRLGMGLAYLRYGCREGGGYSWTFVPIEEDASGKDPGVLMQKYYSLLEEDIRKQPWNYLWTHKRWTKK
ncbi:MAG: hypothetical protein J6T89_02965 [Bacteroidales bacterium]|nr:hypothetical protein [Bacteroidales bacterium]